MKASTGKLAAIALGFLPFLLLEAGLWIFGFGDDAKYRDFDPNQKVFEVRDGMVSIRPELNRRFRTTAFPAMKTTGAYRIMVVGDSVTLGPVESRTRVLLPESYPEKMQRLLAQRYGKRNIEVINLGASGCASYRLKSVLQQALAFGPDLVILQFGASEFHEFRCYGDYMARAWLHSGLLSKCKTLYLARAAIRRFKHSAQVAQQSQGANKDDHLPFTEEDLLKDRKEIDAMVAGARQNVKAMLAACRKANAKAILCTQASNLLNRPEWMGTPPATSTNAQDRLFWNACDQTAKLLKAGRKEAVVSLITNTLTSLPPTHPGVVHLNFMLGLACVELGRFEQAREAFRLAKDFDLNPTRTGSSLNEMLRRIARENGVLLADIEKTIEEASPNKIPGSTLFYDNCHLKPAGHDVVAAELAAAVCNSEDGNEKDILRTGEAEPLPGVNDKSHRDQAQRVFKPQE